MEDNANNGNNGNKCNYCSNTFKSSSNLKIHLTTSKKCMKSRGLPIESNFVCKGCNSVFMTKLNFNVHQESCKEFIVLKITEKYTEENEELIRQNTSYKNQIYDQEYQLSKYKENNKELYEKNLQQENTIKELQKMLQQHTFEYENHIKLQVRYEDLEKQHEKTITKLELKIAQCDSFIQTLAHEGSRKVTTTTNNTVNNNIRNQLSSTYTVDKLEPKQIEDTMRQHYTESDFFGGQKRLAGVCVDKVIKTPDGKMMICCSDMARKKFKILDVQGNLKEDIEARLLCQKLKVPIKMITKEIYDKVIDRIERERDRLSSDDRSRREKLLDDSMRAQQMYMDNLNFDDLNYNQDFMHELCVLLNV